MTSIARTSHDIDASQIPPSPEKEDAGRYVDEKDANSHKRSSSGTHGDRTLVGGLDNEPVRPPTIDIDLEAEPSTNKVTEDHAVDDAYPEGGRGWLVVFGVSLAFCHRFLDLGLTCRFMVLLVLSLDRVNFRIGESTCMCSMYRLRLSSV